LSGLTYGAQYLAQDTHIRQAHHAVQSPPPDSFFTHWDFALHETETGDRALDRRFPAEFAGSQWEATNTYSPDTDPPPAPPPPTDRSVLPPITRYAARTACPTARSTHVSSDASMPSGPSSNQLSQGKTSIVQGVGVVFGTGGLGKTLLAVDYVHRFNLYYPAASSGSTLSRASRASSR
jgi:hypothetical protein